jgi:putative ABC transport system permease protein
MGRRIRYAGRSLEAGEGNVVLDRWYEIVGVVSDFPPHAPGGDPPVPRIYHASPAGDVSPVVLAVRVRGSQPSQVSDRVRQVAAGLDPALQLRTLSSAEEAFRRDQGLMRLIGATLVAVVGSVVALSAAGIYALMSFTVACRRKDIGIRAALGANQTRILAGVFSRALGQLAAGSLFGISSAIAFGGLVEGQMYRGQGAVILPLVAVFMTGVGLLASLGPARRALRMQPTDALREE